MIPPDGGTVKDWTGALILLGKSSNCICIIVFKRMHSPDIFSPGQCTGSFKNPQSPDPFVVVLIVVVLLAIVEVLVPCVVCIVLRRTPIVVRCKTTKQIKQRCHDQQEGLPVDIFLTVAYDSLFAAFELSSARSKRIKPSGFRHICPAAKWLCRTYGFTGRHCAIL